MTERGFYPIVQVITLGPQRHPSREAWKFYCPCFTDGEIKAQRCQEVLEQVLHSTSREIPIRHSWVRGSWVSSQSVTLLTFSTILFKTTSVLIFAIPIKHLRYTSIGKNFFFYPSAENKELLCFIFCGLWGGLQAGSRPPKSPGVLQQGLPLAASFLLCPSGSLPSGHTGPSLFLEKSNSFLTPSVYLPRTLSPSPLATFY